MSISTYSELQTAITDWMDRADLSGNAEDFITLAEASLNRELEAVEADVTLTGTASSRTIDISAYNVIEGINLWLTDPDGEDEEIRLTPKAAGTFPQTSDTQQPEIWALDGDYITFDSLLDQAYTFRFRYQGRFALSDASPTNDLLTNHPDVYLAACIVWGGLYTKDQSSIQVYATALDSFIKKTKTHLAQRKRSQLTVDPTLSLIRSNRRGYYDGTE